MVLILRTYILVLVTKICIIISITNKQRVPLVFNSLNKFKRRECLIGLLSLHDLGKLKNYKRIKYESIQMASETIYLRLLCRRNTITFWMKIETIIIGHYQFQFFPTIQSGTIIHFYRQVLVLKIIPERIFFLTKV